MHNRKFHNAVFLPSIEMSTARLLLLASLFLSAAARMCLSSFVICNERMLHCELQLSWPSPLSSALH